MTACHPAQLSPDELLRQCERSTMRRSGPGGQHRNKTDSACVLRHLPTGVEGQAAERRSQIENQRVALRRLRINLAITVRSQLGEIAPTDLWRRRCPRQQIHVNADHDDFATLLAEALDVLDMRQGNVQSSAEQLQCTSSQLVKLLKKEPRALVLLNQWRARKGLHAIE